MMKSRTTLMVLVAGLLMTTGAMAAGQFGNDGRTSLLAGLYGNNSLGAKFGYTTPIDIEGMSRSGLGLVLAAEAGVGVGETNVNVGAMIGPDLVFILNDTMDLYGGIGVGARLVEDFEIGAGGRIGYNFRANNMPVFLEAGSHPGGIGYLGAGLRF